MFLFPSSLDARSLKRISEKRPDYRKNRMPQIKANPYNWPHDNSLNSSTTALVIIDMQRDCTSHATQNSPSSQSSAKLTFSPLEVCEEGGYLTHQGYDISATRAMIPGIQRLLQACCNSGITIYHTREGHRPDLSDLSSRALFRSRSNSSGVGIGDQGPLGRLLVRGEPGHDIIHELYPQDGEPVIDKPGAGAFTYTDFEFLLRRKRIQNLILCGVTTDVCVHTIMREANDRGYDCLLVEDCCAASEHHLHEAAVEMVRTEGGILGATSVLGDVVGAVEDLLPVESRTRQSMREAEYA